MKAHAKLSHGASKSSEPSLALVLLLAQLATSSCRSLLSGFALATYEVKCTEAYGIAKQRDLDAKQVEIDAEADATLKANLVNEKRVIDRRDEDAIIWQEQVA